jgi:hypothetical protein
MLRTVQFACTLPKDDADALNSESGRLYTDTVVCHYRVSRRTGVWLRPEQGERWEDAHGGPTTLHAHSRDAAQQGFSNACTTAKACQQLAWTPRIRIIANAGAPPSGKPAASGWRTARCAWRAHGGWHR